MPDPARAVDPAGQLVRATGRRLYFSTLALIALLVIGMGVITEVAVLRALDNDVDRALSGTVDATLAGLDGELPSPGEAPEADEAPPGQSDTFVLDLAPDGTVVANPSRVALAGLPMTVAMVDARRSGRDLRTVTLGGIAVRLMTATIGPAARPAGFVQAGFVLTLHDREAASLALTILVAALAGLAGAAVVTAMVTRRSLVPIRRAFEAELRFVADASHELRTPAAIIRATADVLEREGHVGPGGEPLVADIIAESDRLADLVGDLLTLATTGTGALVIRHDSVDLREVAAISARRAAPLAAKRGVAIAVTPTSADGTTVEGDADRLVQLALILLDNAVDHAPAASLVELAVEQHGQSVRLVVSDSGPGIPEAEREQIFEPFARLDRADRRGRGNAGLGLAIARGIAGAHGGTLVATDRQGGGARFVLALPASKIRAPANATR
jgi:signal transduction histidine kinase